MPMTSQQIVSMATQIAKVTGMASQAGQILNAFLTELCQNYDLSINVNTTTIQLIPNAQNNGIGPYLLPANYLRACSRDLTYLIDGIPFRLIQITLAQLDYLINTTGIANYPTNYATDISPQSVPGSNAYLYVYPPPIIPITLQLRFFGSQPEIATPETSSVVPWFPNQTYLVRRLAGELMAITGDPRSTSFLGDGPSGCMGILRKYLELQGDKEDTGSSMVLDPRFFGLGGAAFPPSKVSGGI